MEFKAYQMAEIVMTEKNKEKFVLGDYDDLLALKIYANQQKLEQYKDIYLKFIDQEGIKQNTCDTLGKSLLLFNQEIHKQIRLTLAEKLNKILQANTMVYDEEVLYNLLYIQTESQMWQEVIDLLNYCNSNPKTVRGTRKIINYSKQNMAYCFNNQ